MMAITLLLVGAVLATLLATKGGVLSGLPVVGAFGGASNDQTATAHAYAPTETDDAGTAYAAGTADAVQVATFQQTETAFAAQPYQARYPGFGDSCTDTALVTKNIWSFAGGGTVRCNSDGVLLFRSKPLSYPAIYFHGDQCQPPMLPPSCKWGFPSDYSFAITQLAGHTSDIGGVQPNVIISVDFLSTNNIISYYAQLSDYDGSWQASAGNAGQSTMFGSGAFDATQANTLGMQLRGETLSYLLNGNIVGHTLIPSNLTTTSLDFIVYDQAEFSNFVFTPLQ
jgi:hypothetical protein